MGLFHLLPLLAFASVVTAQGGQTCNATALCPEEAPCCSEYGFCGTGSFCLGGCNPLWSHSLTSCSPEPVCQNATYTLSEITSRILPNSTEFNGNASQYDWVVEGGSTFVNNGTNGDPDSLALILTETNGGTKMSSTRYVQYGKITTRLKTGRWAGVVVASIMMSDIKDEIDWEFPGQNTTEGQSNFFWEGVIPAVDQGMMHDVSNDTFANFHDYTVDWQENSLTWLIDGQSVRTVTRDSATNNGVAKYPQTPSRIEISIWPAGISTEAAGTVQWAGGMINWNDPDYVSAGHFYALIESVTVECYPFTGSNVSAQPESYVYGPNTSQFEPQIALTNESTINGAFGTAIALAKSMQWAMAGALVLAVLASA